MGLDTTHGCWHGSYSGFKAFRDAVAEAARKHDGYQVSYLNHPARAYQGWWDDDHKPRHPLDVFFVHSDCDGWIFPADAARLVDALIPLIPLIEETWRQHLAQFVAGLKVAADEYEIVEFN